MNRIKYFVLRTISNLIISYLHSGGFVIVGPSDATVIWREGSVAPETHFPWHLRPEIAEGEEEPAMPAYLQASLITMFGLGKNWVQEFLQYYLHNEGEVDGDLETYKQGMYAEAVAVDQAVRESVYPMKEDTLH